MQLYYQNWDLSKHNLKLKVMINSLVGYTNRPSSKKPLNN